MMINIDFETNCKLYDKDISSCLEFLSKIKDDSFNYPDGITNFHIYSDFVDQKEIMVVKSYLATQNLDKCMLNVWTDTDISKNDLIKPYLSYIKHRIYSPDLEARETPLEGKYKYIYAKDGKHWMQSGILRFLAIYKYGGIWMDMDMVFLRDFKPIMDQNFAYMWENFTDFSRKGGRRSYGPCAAAVGAIKNSSFIRNCMDVMLNTRARANTTCFDHELLAKVYSKEKFTVFPSCFFNTEWQMDSVVSKPIIDGWFRYNEWSNQLYLDAFSWHWHHSSRKDWIPEEGSKFDLLTKLTNKRLLERGINV